MTKKILRNAFVALAVVSTLLIAGCETPKVKTVRRDPLSGKWILEVFGPKGTQAENRKMRYDLTLELTENKLSGTARELQKYYRVDSDIRGTLKGSEVEWDQYLQIHGKPVGDKTPTTLAGHFIGTISEDGETLSGEALLGDDKMHRWTATRNDDQ